MQYYDLGELTEAVFIERKNRFAAVVELDGVPLEVHIANTGRMQELLYPQAKVYLKRANNPARKTAYDLLLSEYEGHLICLNAHLANDFLAHWLEQGYLAELAAYQEYRREYRYKESRFDFLLANEGEKLLLEVKSVNYLVDHTALFPDAPTARGSRHLQELIDWQEEGCGKSMICFVIMGHDADDFAINEVNDPIFADNLRQAQAKGIEVMVYKSRIEKNQVYFAGKLKY